MKKEELEDLLFNGLEIVGIYSDKNPKYTIKNFIEDLTKESNFTLKFLGSWTLFSKSNKEYSEILSFIERENRKEIFESLIIFYGNDLLDSFNSYLSINNKFSNFYSD